MVLLQVHSFIKWAVQIFNSENLGEKLEELCQVTLAISLDENYMSPFALEARKQGYEREKGGKLDDLTIVANLFQA